MLALWHHKPFLMCKIDRVFVSAEVLAVLFVVNKRFVTMPGTTRGGG